MMSIVERVSFYRAIVFGLSVTVASCGSPQSVESTPTEAVVVEDRPDEEEWLSMYLNDHVLVGRIWSPIEDRWISESDLLDRLSKAHYVLLGEKHDNPDHHRLQAHLLNELVQSGRRPAVAFEMIEDDRQTLIDEALDRQVDADGLAEILSWEERWSGWTHYRGIVTIAIESDLAIVAANVPRDTVRRAVREGLEGFDQDTVARLGLDEPLPDSIRSAMVDELREVHCGHLPEGMADAMVLAQRARDANMADRTVVASSASPDGVVLITGAGHARKDRAVPALIRRRDPDRTIASLAWIEVIEGLESPQEYAEVYSALELPFDAVWFTPRSSDEDPCEAFRRHHRRESVPDDK